MKIRPKKIIKGAMDEEKNTKIDIVKRYHLDIKKKQLKLMNGLGLP